MTASASSTESTIEPRPLPDRQRAPQGAGEARAATQHSVAAIVASLHGRTGKTLLARLLADYFALSGSRPLVFDTDATERTLHAWFPYDTVVVDLGEVRDQMILFDTLVSRSPEARVVDVSHHAFRRFFKVMQDSSFAAEARAREVSPIVFYIADRNPDAYEEARVLRDRFDECGLVLVENAFVGPVKDLTRRSASYRALEDHDLRIALPQLDRGIADAIDDPAVSLSEILNQPLSRGDFRNTMVAGLSFEQRADLRTWLIKAFRDIHRVIRAVEQRAPSLSPADPLA